MLNVAKLSKSFGEKEAVKEVSFSIGEGQIFSLIGPNGSGKTTIVKLLAGLLYPSNGTVTLNDHEVAKDPLATKSITGYIPDEPAVWPGMTGEEFLHFTGALYDVPEAKRLERIPELLKLFDLEGLEKESFDDFSRGNKQKFVILAAMLHEPKLLLVDEPIVGLDPTSADVAKQVFVEFAKRGGMVLLVTHTLSVAQDIATHIGVLRQGELVASGTLAELRDRAKVSGEAPLEDVYRALT